MFVSMYFSSFCLSRSGQAVAVYLLKPQQNDKPAATKIIGREIFEAIRLMDAEERRELTRALSAEKIHVCEATNTPLGCLSDRTVCDSRWRDLAPTSSLFMQRKAGCASLAQKSPRSEQMCKRCAENVQLLFCTEKRALNHTIQRSFVGAPRAPISELSSALAASPKVTVSVPSL